MRVRFPRTAVLVAVLVAVWIMPDPAYAANQHHRTTHIRSCTRKPARCLAGPVLNRLTTLTHARNPNSNDVLDELDDRDLVSDPAPTPSIDGEITLSDHDSTPSWLHARRAVDPRVKRLIVWRRPVAPRPPPSI